MPNQRAKRQKGVLVMMDEKFLAEIDAALPELGYSDRSSFIRTSVYNALKRMKISLPAHIALAPQRTGKGGPRKPVKKTRKKPK